MLRGANNKGGRHSSCTLTSGIVHASEFIPGFVTFVVDREPGIW
jgi:hypothetical protein